MIWYDIKSKNNWYFQGLIIRWDFNEGFLCHVAHRINQVTAVRAANSRWHPTAIICTRNGAAPTWPLFAMFQKNVIVVVDWKWVWYPSQKTYSFGHFGKIPNSFGQFVAGLGAVCSGFGQFGHFWTFWTVLKRLGQFGEAFFGGLGEVSSGLGQYGLWTLWTV
jgi:hypothetical protein